MWPRLWRFLQGYVKRGGKKGGENMAITEKIVKKSLMKQLELQQKNDEFYVDLVNDYMHYWKLKGMLQKDIKEKGVHYITLNGNGMQVEKTNDSIMLLQKTTATMLKILADLNLKEPLHLSSDEDDYL